jgi:phosphonopyruvate decarboxylase
MIKSSELFDSFKNNGINFFTGVPDSLLKDICGYITDNTEAKEHIIAANEGAAVSLATGYYLATNSIPLVYLQNSGLGNTINPLLSISDKEVYGIPMILMIGWRGEPGVKDEPQHVKQGRVQNAILDAAEIHYEIIDSSTINVNDTINKLVLLAKETNSPVALIVKGDTFENYKLLKDTKTSYELNREQAIIEVLNNVSEHDIIVSTTGKSSREVFEYRVTKGQGHQNDFLTVGGMGHANQIALGIALNSKRKVVCIDGDGAVLMHMGSLAIIGNSIVPNYIHIVINNGAHDSVGGQPTIAFNINLVEIAKASGYKYSVSISTTEEIKSTFKFVNTIEGPIFIEIKTNKGARTNLGRPTKTPKENKTGLMQTLLKFND